MKSSTCKVLLIGSHLSNNLGGPSIVLGIIRAFREYLDNCEFVISSSPWDEQAEHAMAKQHGVRFVPLPHSRISLLSTLPCAVISRAIGRSFAFSSLLRNYIRAIQNADVVIGSLGIMFSDALGTRSFRGGIAAGRNFAAAKLLGKPVVQYTADFGPLETKWNRYFAKLWLGKSVDRILCRNPKSYELLKDVGISQTKLLMAPDTGFLMQPVHSEASKQTLKSVGTRPLVAIGVSYQVRCRFSSPDEYDSFILSLSKHVLTEKKCGVLLVPNEIHPMSDRDDLYIAHRIKQQMSGFDIAVVDSKKLTGPELKAVLGKCEVIVSSRYHTLVAGLSTAVPCIAIGWHHKYSELFNLFGLKKWVIDYSQVRRDMMLISAFDRLWDERQSIKRTLQEKLPSIETAILDTAHAVINHLASLTPTSIRLREFQDGNKLSGSLDNIL